MQVINNFGPLSNAELLRRYGFVECSDNPHNCVEFSVEDVVQVSIQHNSTVVIYPFLLQSTESYHWAYLAPAHAENLNVQYNSLGCPNTWGHALHCGSAPIQALTRVQMPEAPPRMCRAVRGGKQHMLSGRCSCRAQSV